MIFAAVCWAGCSSSEETIEDSAVTAFDEPETTAVAASVVPSEKPKSTVPKQQPSAVPQRFTVHADTVDIQRKKKSSSASSSITVKASAPKRFYTVEVGAFRLNSNVQRHQKQLTERFKLPVRVLFDSTLQLTRVCVGTFSTKSGAVRFLQQMKQRYPKDYVDPWVSYWTK